MEKKALLRASALPAAAFLAGIVLGTSSSSRPHAAPPGVDGGDGGEPAAAADMPAEVGADILELLDEGAPIEARRAGNGGPGLAPARGSQAAKAAKARPVEIDRVSLSPSKWTSGKARVAFAVNEALDRDTVASNVVPHVSVSRDGAPLGTKLVNLETRTWRDETIVYVGLLADGPVTNATVRFGADLRGIDRGPLGEAFEKDVSYAPPTIAIRSTDSDVAEFTDRATVVFYLTEEADLDSLRENLRVSPEPEGGWTLVRASGWYSPRYTLTGAFKPDAKYELALRPGIVAADGIPFSLSTNAVPLHTKSAPVALELLSKGHYLTPRDRVGVAFRTQNAPHATVTLARVLPQNVGELARRRVGADHRAWWDESSAQNDSYDLAEHPSLHRRVVVAPAAAPDSVVTNVVALADFADAGAPLRGGAYLLGVSATDTNKTESATRSLDRLVVISDVGIQARRAAGRLDVFAARLSTGLPVAGATISFFAKNGALLGTLPADAEGRATLAEPDSLHRAHLVSAAAPDGDWTFLVLRGENEIEEAPAGAPAGADPYPASPFALAGALFSDRGIYRHGEPVFFEALVRTAKTGRAPEPLPLELAVARPDGVEVQVFKLVSDARGRVAPAAPWTVPEGQPSGKWSAELRVPGSAAHGANCVLARRAFSVEEFAPPQIKAQVLGLPDRALCTDTSVTFRVQGDFFFGAPAAGRPARARAMLRGAPFRPAGYNAKRWRFGPAGEDDEIFAEFSVGAAALDENGSAPFSFAPAETRAKTAPGPVRCIVEGTVQEPGGRQIAARGATTLHVRPWYLGVGLDPAAAGEPLPVEIALVAPDGSVAADAAPELELRFCKVNRSWEYETDARGRWTWRDKKWEDLVEKTNVVAKAGAARAAFRVPADDGDYVVHAAWKGPDGLVTATDRAFSTWGEDAGKRALAGPARLTLTPDRKRYAPGDTARVEIRSPFPGVARVVLQRDVVLETRLVEMTNETASVSFYVSPDMAPGFEVAASVVRPVVPESEWGPHRASGAVSVRVDDPARTLAVAVDAPAMSFADGRATVAARVALPAGADPATARATLFLVDEAVLDLTSEKTPDPTAQLFPGYRTFAEFWDTWAALLRVFDGPYAKTAKIGGDGLGGLLSRLSPVTSRRFKPLALAAQDLAFEDGAATATFDVGTFTGEVRLTAIVWTDRAAGAASANAKVAPALVVQPDAPRFLAPGDKTEFTATVHNTTKAMQTFGWTAGTTGCPGAWGGGIGSFNLEPGRSKTFRFPCTVAADAQPGHAAFAFTARGSGETNRVEIEIPVRPPVAAKTVTETVALAPGEVWTNVPPAGFLPGTETFRVSLEPSPAVQALPALRYLTFYPHGCCEQTASAAFPLVWAQGSLLSFADRGEELPADPEAKIRAAIARLGTMARGDRFAMWPDVSYCDDGASLLAAHFLVEAANAGFDVPKGLRDVAVATARTALRAGPDDRRARASLVLAAAGAPDEAWLLRLLDRRPGLSGAARAQLALALAAVGRPDDALETLRAIPPPARDARDDNWYWWETDRGAVEDAAWGVIAWLAMPSNDALAQAHALYARLLALRPGWAEGHWGWTSVNADALLATASLLRCTSGADRAAARRFPADVAAVTNDATGVRFLVRAARGLPVPESVSAETNGLVVARTFLTREGKPLDPTGADETAAIRQGDTVAVAIDLELRGARQEISDLVVQDLLPAGLEIVAVGSDAHLPWAGGDTHDWLLRADARDDRLLAFSRTVKGKARLVYLAQAVSPGDYVLPALSAEGMYDPLVRASTAPARLKVRPTLP